MSNRDGVYPYYYNENYILAHTGNAQGLRAKLQAGLDPNAVPEGFSEVLPTMLHVAASLGRRHVIQTLREFGADLNVQDANGNTPLFLAVNSEHARSIAGDFLREVAGKVADPNIANCHGYTPLFVAVRDNRLELARALKNAKAKDDIKTYLDETAKTVAQTYEMMELLKE